MFDIIKVPDDKRLAIIDFDLNVERDYGSVPGTGGIVIGRIVEGETFTLNADFEIVLK